MSCSTLKSPSTYQNYQFQRNKTRTCLRQAKKDYYDTVIKESAKKQNHYGLQTTTSQINVYRDYKCDGREVSDSLKIANAFNNGRQWPG